MDEKKIEEVMDLVDSLWNATATQCTPRFQLNCREAIEKKIRELLGEQHG